MVRLRTNHIGDDGIEYIADALQDNEVNYLTQLDCACNNYFKTLTELDISGNCIEYQGARSFAKALRNNQVTILSR